MKIFLDTNVIISAFITHGYSAELMEYCLSNHRIFTSNFIIAEVEKNLKNNFGYNDKEVDEVISFMKSNFTNVGEHKKLDKAVSRDIDDDNVIAAALFEKVDCIITGDKDLLTIKKYKKIKIISPRDFWNYEKFSIK